MKGKEETENDTKDADLGTCLDSGAIYWDREPRKTG